MLLQILINSSILILKRSYDKNLDSFKESSVKFVIMNVSAKRRIYIDSVWSVIFSVYFGRSYFRPLGHKVPAEGRTGHNSYTVLPIHHIRGFTVCRIKYYCLESLWGYFFTVCLKNPNKDSLNLALRTYIVALFFIF